MNSKKSSDEKCGVVRGMQRRWKQGGDGNGGTTVESNEGNNVRQLFMDEDDEQQEVDDKRDRQMKR